MSKPYLKSMDIQGFKSFRDHTHIEFSPKINVILGAHDTGKTNVLDAIKWCLFSNDLDSIKKNELFINDTLIPEGYFSTRLFADGFLKEEVDLGTEVEMVLIDNRCCCRPDISICRFLPTPLCLIDDSISPFDEPLNQVITSMIKGRAETSQCIVVSRISQVAALSDRRIGVSIESGGSTRAIQSLSIPSLWKKVCTTEMQSTV